VRTPAATGLAGADIESALEGVSVPSYCIDTEGIVRWANPAAQRLVGDVVGKQFTAVIAPQDVRRARELFARKIAGKAEVTDAEVVLVGEHGEVCVEVSSVPLRRGGHVIGVFGLLVPDTPEPRQPHPHLTPRQAEVLQLLELGHSTRQIADELHLSVETVRNHVRGILRALGVHSRLEAVAAARRYGLDV
jgi:PAS domain S-box-containing protein